MTQQKRVPASLIHKWRNALVCSPPLCGEGYRMWPWRRFGLMLRSIAANLQRQRTKYSCAAMRLEA